VSKVALASGAVLVTSATDSVILKPGQKATLRNNNDLEISEFSEAEIGAMQEGDTYFQNERLSDIAATLSFKYGTKIELDDNIPVNQRFIGSFFIPDNQDVCEVLQSMIKMYPSTVRYQVYQVGETIHISAYQR
jgi:ferric-dicitrate binding protein FerR (iron transport regulator)